mgnify:CR=1 FL=1
MVYLEAGKRNLLGMPKNELPSVINALKEGWYLVLPLAVLVYLLFSGYTPLYAGTIGLAFIIFLILKLKNIIAWSWIWVTSPLWIPIALILGITLIISTFVILIMLIKLLFSKIN